MKMLMIFHAGMDGKKFMGSSRFLENIFGIAILLLTKIPKYLIVFEQRNMEVSNTPYKLRFSWKIFTCPLV